MLKLSKYNYYSTIDIDNYILFNTFSGAIIRIDHRIYDLLQNKFEELTDDEINVLENLGILIEEDFDEYKVIELDRIKSMCSSETVTYRILTTTACNARCFYCYEKNIVSDKMDLQTACAIVKFIKGNTAATNKIKIQWFGGEPLLNTDVIYYITENIIEYCKETGKEYEFSMVSNGLLVDTVEIERMVLKQVQISLDGSESEYNRRKNYLNYDNAFHRVINNIKYLLEKDISVSVRLNYDKDNLDSIKALIVELSKTIVKKDKFNIYPYPLFGTYFKHKNCNDNPTDEKDYLNLLILLNEHNFLTKKQLTQLDYRPYRCFACNSNSFVINTNGDLAKCTVNIDSKVGTVHKGVIFNEEYFKWCSSKIAEKCESCIFLPLCQGGCMAGQLGSHSVTCFMKKDIIDELLKLIC